MSIRVKAVEAARHYGTSIVNLRKWAREGKIPTEKTPGGHYLYIISTEKQKNTGKNIIYCRVSSKKQQDDLNRQIAYMRKRFPEYDVISDIGSGINYKRKGFQSILEQLFDGGIEKVVVAHKDRFSRFEFDLFQWIFTKFGATLIAMEIDRSNKHELLNDIMEVITVFSARYYGRRKYGDEDGNNSDLSEQISEEIHEAVHENT